MKLNILSENKNELFKRLEVKATIDAEKTPTHEEAEKLLSEHFKTDIDKIKLKKIQGKFGSKTFEISANIYETKEEKEKVERKKKWETEREKRLAEAAKAEAEAKQKEQEESTEEIKQEEKNSEEPKPEEKKE